MPLNKIIGLKGSKLKSYKCKTEAYLNLLIKSLVITWIVSGSSDFFAGDPFPESMDQSIVNFKKSSMIIATKSLSKHIATLLSGVAFWVGKGVDTKRIKILQLKLSALEW